MLVEEHGWELGHPLSASAALHIWTSLFWFEHAVLHCETLSLPLRQMQQTSAFGQSLPVQASDERWPPSGGAHVVAQACCCTEPPADVYKQHVWPGPHEHGGAASPAAASLDDASLEGVAESPLASAAASTSNGTFPAPPHAEMSHQASGARTMRKPSRRATIMLDRCARSSAKVSSNARATKFRFRAHRERDNLAQQAENFPDPRRDDC